MFRVRQYYCVVFADFFFPRVKKICSIQLAAPVHEGYGKTIYIGMLMIHSTMKSILYVASGSENLMQYTCESVFIFQIYGEVVDGIILDTCYHFILCGRPVKILYSDSSAHLRQSESYLQQFCRITTVKNERLSWTKNQDCVNTWA